MDKIQTLKFYNEILINTSLYKYLSIIINERNISQIVREVEYDNFIETTKAFLENKNDLMDNNYGNEMLALYKKYIEKTLYGGEIGIKNNLLSSSFMTFELFLNHLIGIYCRKFSRLYSNENTRLAYDIVKEIKTEDELKDFFIEAFIEKFFSYSFSEKISYIKKNLKLDYDDIWILNGNEYIYEMNTVRENILHGGEQIQFDDHDFYRYINYLCSLIFKISAYSQAKYGIEFEWIANTNLNFKISDQGVL